MTIELVFGRIAAMAAAEPDRFHFVESVDCQPCGMLGLVQPPDDSDLHTVELRCGVCQDQFWETTGDGRAPVVGFALVTDDGTLWAVHEMTRSGAPGFDHSPSRWQERVQNPHRGRYRLHNAGIDSGEAYVPSVRFRCRRGHDLRFSARRLEEVVARRSRGKLKVAVVYLPGS
jgi:hypothetical protein